MIKQKLYLIYDPRGATKVGVSYNAKMRLRQLADIHRRALKLVYVHKHEEGESPFDTEGRVRRLLAPYKEDGSREWFKCSPVTALWAVFEATRPRGTPIKLKYDEPVELSEEKQRELVERLWAHKRKTNINSL